jgi:hypothetical protein
MCLHGPTATETTITNGIETPKHCVFEESVVDMSTIILFAQDIHSLRRGNPARSLRVVLGYEASKWFTYDQTNIDWLARIGSRRAARALQDNNMIGILQHNITRLGIGNDLLQIGNGDIPIDRNQPFGCFKRHNLSMIGICEGPIVVLDIRFLFTEFLLTPNRMSIMTSMSQEDSLEKRNDRR